MTHYTLEACEQLIQRFTDHEDCSYITINEGCLGLGTVLLYRPGYKLIIIQERYLNPWSSTHTVRMYNKIPKKYQSIIDNY